MSPPLRLPSPDFDRMVVGVDGSSGSDRALRWAAKMAQITGAEVLAVHGFEYVPMRGAETNEVLLDQARTDLDGRWTAVLRDDGIGYRTFIEVEDSRELLDAVALEEKADVIVVGSRGHGEVADLLLGSVAAFLAHHATVPVVIIPGEARLSRP